MPTCEICEKEFVEGEGLQNEKHAFCGIDCMEESLDRIMSEVREHVAAIERRNPDQAAKS